MGCSEEVTIYISQKQTCKGVQRKLQYTYYQNKLVGCSEKLTVYISSK